MHVLVLAGGLSAERDVSLRSGRRVAEALRIERPDWEVQLADVDAQLLDHLRDHRPDVVIPLLHGAAGEDGALRDVLQSLGIPFVGSIAATSRLAFDKPVAKRLITDAGLRTPDCVAMPQSTFRELGSTGVLTAVVERLGLPLVVKPAKGGSALGASIVHDASDLPAAMIGAFAYGDVVIMEQFISGTEVAVGVFERDGDVLALPAVEIVPESELYDYSARYTAGTTEFFCPARLTDEQEMQAQAVALNAHVVLGLRDWSRTDLIVDADGEAWFLEVNVAPGMTETSLVPQALSAADVTVGGIMSELAEVAAER
ncbi:MAG: D-alanine--D-alanine ligase [Candidatus Nanopelagicales bacterium]|nr:D-alanine--D-alanine ligase [Candidatus Nanopelagicales bacterium]MCF8537260.1 D-alanine--D-alanine ligase [Candidatus Nanopelagicales bacterium]MCF8558008.1 D-alanine--D-alanine ligase [Candidatus Nanopelagicales bacterium]